MRASLHRFVRLLRRAGLRISTPEAIDAMRCASRPSVLTDRDVLREALRASLVKQRPDVEVFEEAFDAFFSLVKVGPDDGHGHGHGHGHEGLESGDETLDEFSISEDPPENPLKSHEHGEPSRIAKYFDPEDLSAQYQEHGETSKVDLASMSDEINFSTERNLIGDADRVQLDTERLHGAGMPHELAEMAGTKLDAELTVSQQDALLGWLSDAEDDLDDDADEDSARRMRTRLSGILDRLPEALKAHLEALMELEDRVVERHDPNRQAEVERIDERERAQLDDSLRRLADSFRGAPRPRRRVAPRGRIDSARTMRANMRYDGIPFRPVTVVRAEDKPRLVVLADVSLSVRTTARFTLHLVHGLQGRFQQVRSFAFVADLVEITDLFVEHQADTALGTLFGGDVLDVDGNSDYGHAFGRFVEEYDSAVTRRTTVLVLGDGRGNGNDPNIDAFEYVSRRARETVWLTPEPRFSWSLGGCDLPEYAEYCDRVRVVRDLGGLARIAEEAPARRR